MKKLGILFLTLGLMVYGEEGKHQPIMTLPAPIAVETNPLEITIIHVNDHHSHLEEDEIDLDINGKSTRFKYGGFSRLTSEIKDMKEKAKNPIVLHAGDAMTGTLYYTLFKGVADAELMNEVGFDAFVLGNHEFDGGDEVLSKFLDKLEVPVVAANVVADKGNMLENKWSPYIIKEVEGEKIGIIGIDIIGKTQASSNPSDQIKFYDEVETAQRYAKDLESKGINKIVLLTHYGYTNALELAKKVEGIDVIVSGDQHSLLGENFKEYGLNVQGEYPTKEVSKRGEPVYIVEGWEYSHLVGNLKVKFDKKGIVTEVEGTPVIPLGDSIKRKNTNGDRVELEGTDRQEVYDFINNRSNLKIVKEDDKINEVFKKYKDEKNELSLEKIGEVLDTVPGGSENRIPNEANPNGSYAAVLVSEAFYDTLKSMGKGHIDFVLQNAGGVRTGIKKGDLTIDDAYTLLPFSNTLYVLDLKGSEIKQVIEEAMDYALQEGGSTGAFPYGARIRYEATKSGELGTRVKKIEVYNEETKKWNEIDMDKMYKVGTNSYVSNGKDGYKTFGEVKKNRGGEDTYLDYAQSFVDYVKKNKTISNPESTNVKFEY